MERQKQLCSWCCAALNPESASPLVNTVSWRADPSLYLVALFCSAFWNVPEVLRFTPFLCCIVVGFFINQSPFTPFSFASTSPLWNSLWNYFEWEHLEALISCWSPSSMTSLWIVLKYFISSSVIFPIAGLGGGGVCGAGLEANCRPKTVTLSNPSPDWVNLLLKLIWVIGFPPSVNVLKTWVYYFKLVKA